MNPKMLFIFIIIILLIVFSYLFLGQAPRSDDITFGVNFSQKHSQNLGLDWKENFLAILDDLKVRELKIITHWDLIEPERGKYDFNDLDWQMEQADKKGANVILVIGFKTGRWPECHIPEWAKGLSQKDQQQRILALIERIVERYQNSSSLAMWQVENEPFFPFGDCPWKDKHFLKKEIILVRSLDLKGHHILMVDSGEGSFWFTSAMLGDIVGITMYKEAWFSQLNTYVFYPLPPVFYWRKALLIKNLFNKEVIVAELQAEPWGPKLLYDISLEEQAKTMNLERFKYNIDFAKRTGFDKFYLWGAEWWYWMKETQGQGSIWSESKNLF